MGVLLQAFMKSGAQVYELKYLYISYMSIPLGSDCLPTCSCLILAKQGMQKRKEAGRSRLYKSQMPFYP